MIFSHRQECGANYKPSFGGSLTVLLTKLNQARRDGIFDPDIPSTVSRTVYITDTDTDPGNENLLLCPLSSHIERKLRGRITLNYTEELLISCHSRLPSIRNPSKTTSPSPQPPENEKGPTLVQIIYTICSCVSAVSWKKSNVMTKWKVLQNNLLAWSHNLIRITQNTHIFKPGAVSLHIYSWHSNLSNLTIN